MKGTPVAVPSFLQDLPTLYLQGGSIIPVGLPVHHVGEMNLTDDLSLFVALDDNGKAEGVLFEDDGDGYGYVHGAFLLTYYTAELQSSIITVKVSKTEGSWKRPKRFLHVHVILGGGAMINGKGIDGEEIQTTMPSNSEVSNLILASENQYRVHLERARPIPDVDRLPGQKGIELSKTPVDLKSGDWALKWCLGLGAELSLMTYLPSGGIFNSRERTNHFY
ncbi:uncharacterized protein A4U43_C04F9230 [Asparagus officinalis]|uniref:DUF5110 domain-containing protein n=1 Tax=Asparagus officinalis TaxID=4686 RepID=A0A5P1F056_ASPOF|nr:uncharacterized protein A4U43_C04F9230 [Asparagus officinalis]